MQRPAPRRLAVRACCQGMSASLSLDLMHVACRRDGTKVTSACIVSSSHGGTWNVRHAGLSLRVCIRGQHLSCCFLRFSLGFVIASLPVIEVALSVNGRDLCRLNACVFHTYSVLVGESRVITVMACVGSLFVCCILSV